MSDVSIASAWHGDRNWPEPVDHLVQHVTNELILTDALTMEHGERGTYLVDEDNLEYLVKTILDLAGYWYSPTGETIEEVVDTDILGPSSGTVT